MKWEHAESEVAQKRLKPKKMCLSSQTLWQELLLVHDYAAKARGGVMLWALSTIGDPFKYCANVLSLLPSEYLT